MKLSGSSAALLSLAATARASPQPPALGSAVPESLLFGVCLQAVTRGTAKGGDWKAACMDSFGSSPDQPDVSAQCAKFAGRAEEADEQGYLGTGTLLCSGLVKERSLATGSPLATYMPAQCVDAPSGWTSYMGSACSDYDSNEWCTPTKGYGAGWETSWGSFDNYAVEGLSADIACCACGGGHQGDAAITASFCDSMHSEVLDACTTLVDPSRDSASRQQRSGQ